MELLIYLDANIVIYAVEYPAVFGPQAQARLQNLSNQDRIAVSELTRLQCCSHPLRQSDFSLLRLYDAFFLRPDVTVLPFTTNVFRQAIVVQAMNDFATVNSLHLACAVEHSCQLFLTNDIQLSKFTKLTVELLS